jgi:3-oxoacyl-[acyl-carrier protein] reductase
VPFVVKVRIIGDDTARPLDSRRGPRLRLRGAEAAAVWRGLERSVVPGVGSSVSARGALFLKRDESMSEVPDPTPLQGKAGDDRPVAFVTGAAQGIGLATARRLARDGFSVHAMDRSAERLAASVAAARADGLDVSAHPIDICDRAQVRAALDSVPRVDAMVCAAGVYSDATILELTEDEFRRVLEVNVIGTFIPAQEAARRMRAGGRIVTISSRGALGGTRFAHYVASKSAVIGLTRAMAMELRGRLIAVNSVAPGFTDTPMTRSAGDELFASWEALEPSGKAANPDEIAHAIAFLASPATAFITGQTLFVDGGKSLGGQLI